MAVRIRLKRMGRIHRPFYRICAMDGRAPRDGKVIEELGFYDPLVKETDARAVLNGERIAYWIGVGAQPSDKVQVLIKKYGVKGTHLEQQRQALERVKLTKPKPPPPMIVPRKKADEPAPVAESQSAPGEEPQAPAPEAAPQESGE
ncbi:MAG: 30S ribosomal protein S16 [Planctomycetota bacterium]|nr:30S ribosomal protein S16 [Planctomycetota bacterium]